MLFLRQEINKNSFSFLNILKIIFFLFFSIWLLGNFSPYYEGVDSLLYGEWGIRLSQGQFGFTNELLQNVGSEFVPTSHVKTVHDTAIPVGNVGIYGISAFSYLIGGYYGLFYLGPVAAILLIFFSERIATNLFGKFAGTITLVLVGTDSAMIRYGGQLLTDSIFALFFILGCFYFIKFLKERNSTQILACSIFFVISTFFRLNGLILFPFEILLLFGFFVIQNLQYSKTQANKKNYTKGKSILLKIKSKKFVKSTIYLLLPWLVFFMIFFAYNYYFFGDPISTYKSENLDRVEIDAVSNFSWITLDSDRFEWIKFYSVGLLPDLFLNNMLKFVNIEFSDSLNSTWLSIFSFSFFAVAIGVSLFVKKKRKEVLVFSTLVASFLIFYSADFIHPVCGTITDCTPTSLVRDRFMIPGLVLSFMLVGLFFNQISEVNFSRISLAHSKTYSNVFKVAVILFVIFFLVTSIFISGPFKKTINSGFSFQNPETYTNRFPIDLEGLSPNSVIMSHERKFLEYESIPFSPYVAVEQLLRHNQNHELIPQEPIHTLKNIINEGYEVFIFKEKSNLDNWYLRYLETNQGIIAKDYSKSFCKLELINNPTESEAFSDSICHTIETIRVNG